MHAITSQTTVFCVDFATRILYIICLKWVLCAVVFIKNVNAVNMVILIYILKQAGISLPALLTLHS